MTFVRTFFGGVALMLAIVIAIVSVIVWTKEGIAGGLLCAGFAAFFLIGSFSLLRSRPGSRVVPDNGPLFPPGHEHTVREVLHGAGGIPRVEMTYIGPREVLKADGGHGWDGRFFSKVAGVSHRQAAAARCKNGELVGLRREPRNEHDPNAVAIYSERGEQLGYLNARWAKTMAPLLDRGLKAYGRITHVTGGGEQTMGVNIEVWGVGGPPINDDI